MIFIYIPYFVISIFVLWLCYYFRRFTLVDYKYNKQLNRKRRFAIIFTYVMMFLQGQIVGARRLIIYPIDNLWIVSAALAFIIAYIFLLGRVEIPKYPFKKK